MSNNQEPRRPTTDADMTFVRSQLDRYREKLKKLGPKVVSRISQAFLSAIEEPNELREWEREKLGFIAMLAACQLQQLIFELNLAHNPNSLERTEAN